jgi:hypothetical protein
MMLQDQPQSSSFGQLYTNIIGQATQFLSSVIVGIPEMGAVSNTTTAQLKQQEPEYFGLVVNLLRF